MFTIASYGQALFDEGIQIKNNATDNSATKVNVQSTDGTINTISKADLVNVVEVNDVPSLPLIGEVGKIYVVKNLNKIYRWNGTFYQELAVTDITYQSVIDVLTFTPENVANKATDFTMANNTLYPTVQAVKAYALNLINAKQAGAIGDGVADDTATLQAYLNSGQGTYIFPKSDYVVSGLDVNSDSKLIFEKGARLILKNNSDRPVLQNKNFSLNVDKNIEIYGLEIEGNEANQIKVGVLAPYTGEPTSGVRFFGVENLKIIGAKINNTRTYGIWISRVRNVIARDIEFNQSLLTIDNQDGMHFNGLCYNLDISNIRGVTNDDMIALNANDVAQGANVSLGEIKNATIKDVIFQNNLNGIRLLSAGNLLDQIYINNLSGNVRDNVVAISSYTLGTANFGSIYIDGVNVTTNTPHNVLGEYGGYILVNDKIDYLKISNVYRKTGADARPTVRIQSRAVISKLVIDNITTKINPALTAYYPEISFESGSIVAQAFLSNVRLMNGVFPNGYCIGATGSAITRLHLENIYAEQIGYGLYLNNTDISTLFVNGTSTNFIRYPFYLVNDSDIGLAVIDNQRWAYSVSSPKVYNILDTSSIVFANSPVENSILKYDDTFNSISSTLKEIGSELTNTSVGNGSALDLNKISGFGSSITLRNSSVSSNALLRLYKPDNVSFYNIYTSSTGLETDGSVTAEAFNGSATLTGIPTAPTAAAGTNTTQIATTAFVQANSVNLTGVQTITGVKTFSDYLYASAFAKIGGTSLQFLKADGSVDESDVVKNIAKDATQGPNITGTVSETILYSKLIPANTFKDGDFMNLFSRVARPSPTASSGGVEHKIRVNTSNTLTGSIIIAKNNLTAGVSGNQLGHLRRMFNVSNGFLIGITSAFNNIDDSANSNASPQFNVFNPTVDNYIFITGQLGFSGDTMYNLGTKITN